MQRPFLFRHLLYRSTGRLSRRRETNQSDSAKIADSYLFTMFICSRHLRRIKRRHDLKVTIDEFKRLKSFIYRTHDIIGKILSKKKYTYKYFSITNLSCVQILFTLDFNILSRLPLLLLFVSHFLDVREVLPQCVCLNLCPPWIFYELLVDLETFSV